jgi:hypothetical protein
MYSLTGGLVKKAYFRMATLSVEWRSQKSLRPDLQGVEIWHVVTLKLNFSKIGATFFSSTKRLSQFPDLVPMVGQYSIWSFITVPALNAAAAGYISIKQCFLFQFEFPFYWDWGLRSGNVRWT